MSAPELTRLVRTRALPAGEMIVTADAAERAALAQRFGVSAVEKLTARVRFEPVAGAVRAEGVLAADIVQPCAVTGEPLRYPVDEALSLRFVPAEMARAYAPDEEIELTAEELDEIEYEGDAIDIGEAIAQTLALAIDPYREGPGADAARAAAGVVSDEAYAPEGPLAEALRNLRGS